jgi:hypothetical protein
VETPISQEIKVTVVVGGVDELVQQGAAIGIETVFSDENVV